MSLHFTCALTRSDCCLQKYQDDVSDIPSQSGPQSLLYTALTVTLVATGAAYLLQPVVRFSQPVA